MEPELELDPELEPDPQPLSLPLPLPEPEPDEELEPEPEPEPEPQPLPLLLLELEEDPDPLPVPAAGQLFHAASGLSLTCAPTNRIDRVTVVVPERVEVIVLVEVTVFFASQVEVLPVELLLLLLLLPDHAVHSGLIGTVAGAVGIGTVTVLRKTSEVD